MQNQVLVCPDRVVFERVAKKKAILSEGSLSKQLVYTEPSDKLDLGKLVNATNGEVKVFLADYSEQAKLPINLIIPSIASYLALHISSNEVDATQVNTLLKTWQSYFEACKQLLLMHPDAFVAKGINISAHINIREATQHALNNDEALLQLHEDWSTFVAKKDKALRPLNKYLSELGADLREVERLRSEVERLCGEREDRERTYRDELKLSVSELANVKAEKELLGLQIAQLQEELEEVFLRNLTLKSNTKETPTPSHKGSKGSSIEALPDCKEQSELTAENELLAFQISYLQEELEHYFIQYNKSLDFSREQAKQKIRPKGPLNEVMLLQSTVERGTEKLVVRIKNLNLSDMQYNLYDLTIIAKRVRDGGFTSFATLELRVLPGKKAPLQDWKPNQRDSWGRKLSLDLNAIPSPSQETQLSTLSRRDRKFLQNLFVLLGQNTTQIHLNNTKVQRPLEHWQGLFVRMSEAINLN